MKTLLVNSKNLLAAAVIVALTGCGGEEVAKDGNVVSPPVASKAASSVAVSSAAAAVSSAAAAVSSAVASSKPASSAAASSAAAAAGFVFFEEAAAPGWKIWDCCGGTTPTVLVAADAKYGQVANFEIIGSTVVGFDSRKQTPATPTFDASPYVKTGTISFDILLTQAPKNPSAAWKLKVESNNTASDIDFSKSQEGVDKPVLNVWTHLTFDLQVVKDVGAVDMTILDVVMVFPAWGSGDGAKFQLDNVKISTTGATPE